MFIISILLKLGKHILIGFVVFLFFSGFYSSIIGTIEVGKTEFSTTVKFISRFSLIIYFSHLLGILYIVKYYFKYNFIRATIYSSFIHFGEIILVMVLFGIIKNLDFTLIEIPLFEILPYLDETFRTEEVKLEMMDKLNKEVILIQNILLLSFSLILLLSLFNITTATLIIKNSRK